MAAATGLKDVCILEPRVFDDERGNFFVGYNARHFAAATGEHVTFVQDNQSFSQKGVLRGLHYQAPPHAQGKLIRVLSGEVFDVALDLRRSSPTFGKWEGFTLSGEKPQLLWLPPGFAHGFCVTSQNASFFYKVTDYYAPATERAICWNDPALAIDWPVKAPILSAKDKVAKSFAEAELFP